MKRTKGMLLFLMVVLWLAGCGNNQQIFSEETESEKVRQDEDSIVVGIVQIGSESDWRAANTQSFKRVFTEENGYTLLFEDGQQKQENQLKALRNFILMDVDYIVLAPIVETGWDAVLQEAADADIPVLLVDRMVDVEDDSLWTCWVGTDFEQEGRDAGEWLVSYLEKQGRSGDPINIVTLQGTAGSTAQLGRTKGFAEVMETQNTWTMLDARDADFTQAKGREVMEAYLERYPDIDVVVSENDNMAFGAIAAIEDAGKTCGPDGEIIMISFDAVRAAFEAMIDGKLNVSVECNPLHGEKIAEVIQQLERGETPEKIIYVDGEVFSAETAAQYLDSRMY